MFVCFSSVDQITSGLHHLLNSSLEPNWFCFILSVASIYQNHPETSSVADIIYRLCGLISQTAFKALQAHTDSDSILVRNAHIAPSNQFPMHNIKSQPIHVLSC